MNAVRRVVRIAAYQPKQMAEGRPVGAFDEDAFTIGATAAERAWYGRREGSVPLLLHLLGEFPPVAEWGFGALLGRSAEVVRHKGDSGELARTLEELEGSEGEVALVVAVDLAEKPATGAAGRSPPTGAGAVAYVLEPTETARPFAVGKTSASRSAVAATLRLGPAGAEATGPVELVGDWEWDPGSARAVDGARSSPVAPEELGAVSEGAYVPRARYLENLPSRWRFLAEACGDCHGTTFPARGVCRRCGRSGSLTPVDLPLDGGRVIAVTTVGPGGQPTEFDRQVATVGPYDVALVELARGVRVTLQVTDSDPGELRVGDHVSTLLRRLYPMEGEWRYGRKAVPVHPPAATSAPNPSN